MMAPWHRAGVRRRPRPRGSAEGAGEELRALRAELAELRGELVAVHTDLAARVRSISDDDAWIRSELRRVRCQPGYDEAFALAEPLVSIVIPTLDRAELLATRSVPSALAQSHPSVEVIVVGDAAPPEVEEALFGLDDPRVRFENLTMRGFYPSDPYARWLVAGTAPVNRGLELARGRWVAFLNDDDAMRPDHVATLLAHARGVRAEVAYGRLEQHGPHGATPTPPAWPEAPAFGWQTAIQHHALSFIDYSLAAADHGDPGDWFRARRMLRAGVRFSATDAMVADYYPSTLWR